MGTEMAFQHPWVLWLLLLLPPLGMYYWRHRHQMMPAVVLPTLEHLRGFHSMRGKLTDLLFALRLLTLALVVVALARPRHVHTTQRVEADAVDIVLALDVSVSMLSKDFDPDRLEVSKAMAIDFVKRRPYDRFGVVEFSGEALTLSPLTTDHDAVIERIASLTPGILQDGTAIGMGLATAVSRLKDSPAKSKVVILLSDGVNNTGYIDPMTAAAMARELGIKVYTIAVGTKGSTMTPVSRSSDGRYIFALAQVEVDDALLKAIAETTGGKFFQATNELALERVYDEIDRLEKTRVEVTRFKRYSEAFHPFVAAALLLLLLEILTRYLLLRPLP